MLFVRPTTLVTNRSHKDLRSETLSITLQPPPNQGSRFGTSGNRKNYGHARVSFHHSKNTISLASKSGKTALSEICKASTPPCKLNPLLFNGHLHTAWTAVKAAGPPIVYKRQIFESDDPRFAGTFAVDFVTHEQAPAEDSSLPPRTTYFAEDEFANIGSDDTKPMLITLHGLSGGSHEIYLRHVLEPLVDQSEQGDWEAIVVNSRGCAMSKITTGILYNARATWDLRQTVKWCRKMYPNRPLFAIGYSLGANILTNVRRCGGQCHNLDLLSLILLSVLVSR